MLHSFLHDPQYLKFTLPIMTFASAYGMVICKRKFNKFREKLEERYETQQQQEKVKTWMYQKQVNTIIDWKKEHPSEADNYFKFIRDTFPENIKVEDEKIVWIDHRILGDNWKGTFLGLKATDKKYVLSQPPGTEV